MKLKGFFECRGGVGRGGRGREGEGGEGRGGEGGEPINPCKVLLKALPATATAAEIYRLRN